MSSQPAILLITNPQTTVKPPPSNHKLRRLHRRSEHSSPTLLKPKEWIGFGGLGVVIGGEWWRRSGGAEKVVIDEIVEEEVV
ncbi:hypothetical protein AgCh_000457 [Apium graveolens]